MPNWTDATDAPKRFQFEESSGTMECSATTNCGITAATQIADFYKNKAKGEGFAIERGRTLAKVPKCQPTTAWQQADVLRKRGVACQVIEFASQGEFDKWLGYGKRPMVVGIQFSRLSAATRGHTFTGWHATCFLARGQNEKGEGGYFYTDPNFSPAGGHRPDPKRGKRWMSRKEFNFAFFQNSPRFCVVPTNKKG